MCLHSVWKNGCVVARNRFLTVRNPLNLGCFMDIDPGKIQSRKIQAGQGMTEYIIIVALIAVAAIGVYSWFGQAIRGQTAGLANEVAGNDAQGDIAVAQSAATEASSAAAQDKGLANYNAENNQQGGGN